MRKPHPKSRPFKTPDKPAGGRQDRPERRGPQAPDASHSGGGVPAPSVGRSLMLYGIHAVTAAWLNPDRPCRHLYATAQALTGFAPVVVQAAAQGLKRPAPIPVERDAIEKLLPLGAVHQGLALDAEPLPEVDLEDVLIATGNEPATFVLLDQVTDPHNVGAILRSAAALGANGVIVQTRHAPEVTGVLAKAASGAVEIVPLLRETNLSRAIEHLRDEGFFVVGLDERGETTIADAVFGERVVLALGAEGEGLRRLVAENCSQLVSLPSQPPIRSLNVSNAAAIGLYEIARRRMR
ncbi:MAG: rRNA ((2251)-2-O)-methyltransferase RlmB [Rhodospirillales bacterium]|nr:rRNA ((2251)-2-O)-methyltransferase RlmB [Rhodospirillales bacterium]